MRCVDGGRPLFLLDGLGLGLGLGPGPIRPSPVGSQKSDDDADSDLEVVVRWCVSGETSQGFVEHLLND